MTMAAMAIELLWLLIYVIIFAGVVWLVLYGISQFVRQIPPRVEQGIWFIVLILVIIAFVTVLAGGNVASIRPYRP
jgi:hypothetical protein